MPVQRAWQKMVNFQAGWYHGPQLLARPELNSGRAFCLPWVVWRSDARACTGALSRPWPREATNETLIIFTKGVKNANQSDAIHFFNEHC